MSQNTMPPVFDGHNDTLLDLYQGQGKRSFFSRSELGHLDLPRAREGGLGGGFFAIFTPTQTEKATTAATLEQNIKQSFEEEMAPAVDQDYARQFTLAVAAQLFRLEDEAQGQIKVVRTVDELTTCLHQGILAIIFHIEGAEAIDPDLDTLYVLHRAGLRSLGIVWSRPNIFGHGVPFKISPIAGYWTRADRCRPRSGPGLQPAGDSG